MSKATPSQEWVLSADEVTMLSPVERVEEVIREKIYRCLHREVPHHVQQVNRNFQFMQGDNKMLRVDQDLVVTTKSHQRLVLGQGGKTLKRIQETAKVDLEHMFGCPVMLHLHVKLTKSKQPQTLFSETQGTRIVFPS
jgi:GTP-binding protein Era